MLKNIPVDLIDRDPNQPRQIFDEAALHELKTSIEKNGLKQPITVRKMDGGRYQIVMGERRWRAHCLIREEADAGEITNVLCFVKKMDDATKTIDAIIENLERVDISPLEEANAFARAMETCDLDVAGLAEQLGKQPFRIEERLVLLKLRPEYQQLFAARQITSTQAYEMARLDGRGQDQLFDAIKKGLVNTAASLKAAAAAIAEAGSQVEFFPGLAGPSDADRKVVSAMDKRIETIAGIAQVGFTRGEITIAKKVNKDKAELMAQRLDLIARHVALMAEALRSTEEADQPELEAVA